MTEVQGDFSKLVFGSVPVLFVNFRDSSSGPPDGCLFWALVGPFGGSSLFERFTDHGLDDFESHSWPRFSLIFWSLSSSL